MWIFFQKKQLRNVYLLWLTTPVGWFVQNLEIWCPGVQKNPVRTFPGTNNQVLLQTITKQMWKGNASTSRKNMYVYTETKI